MAKIFVTRDIPEVGITKMQEAGHDVMVSEKDGALTHDELLASIAAHTPDALVSLLTDTIGKDVLEAAPSIQVIANYAVGYNNIDLEVMQTANVIVTHTPGVLTDTVAEHAIAMLLATTRRVAEGDRFMRKGLYTGWDPQLLLGTDVRGKTLGIVGMGSIGSRVAEIAQKGLGMHIIYYDIHKDADSDANEILYIDTLHDMLDKADVVSIHVPLNEGTKHLIDATALTHMKKTAYIVNTARGGVIEESALVEALESAAIAGAALDVYEHEPNLSDKLASLENVVLTPHNASATHTTRDKMSEMVADNVIAVLAGKTPPHPVV